MSIGNSPEDERPFADVSSEEAPSIGHVLRQARIEAGMTVDDVSTATRIRIAIVHAIEADDFTSCGGDVYARGHIRTIARAVHTDPAPLITRFDASHGGRPAPTPAAPLFEAERIRPERKGPNWTAAMVAAIVAVIGFVGFTAFKGDGDSDKTDQIAGGASPSPSVSTTPPTPKSEKPPADGRPTPSDDAIAAAPQDKVTVRVSATHGRSWISAKDHNGRLLFDDLLKQGQSKTFQDNSKINLVLGDAGSIELWVNGKKLDNDFKAGAVERLTYTKGDPQAG
ncbi:helix-turn-helix domain-containing protein [Streptomyces sp. S6]